MENIINCYNINKDKLYNLLKDYYVIGNNVKTNQNLDALIKFFNIYSSSDNELVYNFLREKTKQSYIIHSLNYYNFDKLKVIITLISNDQYCELKKLVNEYDKLFTDEKNENDSINRLEYWKNYEKEKVGSTTHLPTSNTDLKIILHDRDKSPVYYLHQIIDVNKDILFTECKNNNILLKYTNSTSNLQEINIGSFKVKTCQNLFQEIQKIQKEIAGGNKIILNGLIIDVSRTETMPLTKYFVSKKKTNEANPFFVVASQFNCLEMISEDSEPEDGIGVYFDDNTQGPRQAMAGAFGTLYRNYGLDLDDTKFNKVISISISKPKPENKKGQFGNKQLNLIKPVLEELYLKKTDITNKFSYKNGYLKLTLDGLKKISTIPGEIIQQTFFKQLHLGIVNNTPLVFIKKKTFNLKLNKQYYTEKFNQIFVSAIPMYNYQSEFIKSYLKTGSLKYEHGINKYNLFYYTLFYSYYGSLLESLLICLKEKKTQIKLVLTQVGGGAFANPLLMIDNAIDASIRLFKKNIIDKIKFKHEITITIVIAKYLEFQNLDTIFKQLHFEKIFNELHRCINLPYTQ